MRMWFNFAKVGRIFFSSITGLHGTLQLPTSFSFSASSGYCHEKQATLNEMCTSIKSDDTLYSMFRVNSKPIPCPFSGSSFTFTYDKGFGECAAPISLGEKCTDESKLLLKYQACPDIKRSESNSKFHRILYYCRYRLSIFRISFCLIYFYPGCIVIFQRKNYNVLQYGTMAVTSISLEH